MSFPPLRKHLLLLDTNTGYLETFNGNQQRRTYRPKPGQSVFLKQSFTATEPFVQELSWRLLPYKRKVK